jgi:hypothetical protein
MKVAVIETVVIEFQKTGIFPFDPNVFPDWKHEPEETIRTPQQDKLDCQKTLVSRMSWRRKEPTKSKNSRTVTETANKE